MVFFWHILLPIAQNLKCATLFVSHTHTITFTHTHARGAGGYIFWECHIISAVVKKWNLTIYPSWHFYFKRKLFSLQGVCVCVTRQRVCVGEYVCFLEGVNRNLFKRFSISAGVAQRERKIRLPAARYYLLPPPIYHSFSGRGGSAACFRLTTVHLREPQSTVFLPQLKALPVSHCFSHSDVASEG